jgi:signal transduction histidine kinase/CheY-like chemotaxis protein/HPt (histidine-containing phosphotransfer) domain-containing protein
MKNKPVHAQAAPAELLPEKNAETPDTSSSPAGRLSIKARFTLFFIFFLIAIFSLMLILSVRQVFEVISLVNTVDVIDSDYETGSIFYTLLPLLIFQIPVALVIIAITLAVYFYLIKKVDRQSGYLLEMKEKSNAASEAKSSFLTNTSHEIRTPMNAIIGMSELALREELGNKAREFINHILQAGGNLLIIINDILDYSRIESGKMVLSNGEYYLASLITDCISIISMRIGERQENNYGIQGRPLPAIRLVNKISEGLPSRLFGDESRIRQILLSVLNNAIKYTREGAITLTVRREGAAELFQGDSAVLIFEIEDTGVGIKEEELSLTFGDFSRLNQKANYGIGAAGLGLAFSRKLIRLMGGDISVTSQYGKGSVFTVVLPQTVLDPAAFTPPETGDDGKAFQPPFTAPSARVLVVDNISANLIAAEKLLEPYKIQIDCCANGEGAVMLLEERPYDIVFMDHEMPGMDGIETTVAIRALDRDYAQDLPIIALTANAVSNLREYFLARKFNDYLLKPMTIPRLNKILEQWLPLEKRGDSGAAPPHLVIKNVDTAKGIAMTGGTEAGYRQVLTSFYNDARSRLDFFLELPETETLSLFTIQVHALKSASAVIGAAKVSAEAAALEAAGKEGKLDAIEDQLPVFYQDLSDLVSTIGDALGLYADDTDSLPEAPADLPACFPKLRELLETIKREEIGAMNRLLAELEQEPLDPKSREIMAQISDQILVAEFAAAIETIGKLLPNSDPS